jgi:RNA-binding protein
MKMPDMTLSNAQLRHLRGLSHQLQPVVMVADKGLTENVLAEIDSALERHELIKVKLRADRGTRAQWIDEIARHSAALTVHSIGQVACFFRRNPEKPVVELPGR